MKKLEFSHREAFHRHLANIYNVKERHSLVAKNKYFERCKDIQQYAFSREEKELKRQLANLLWEKNHIKEAGSCLDAQTRDDIERDLAQEKPTAHDVAARMIQCLEIPKQENRNIRDINIRKDLKNGDKVDSAIKLHSSDDRVNKSFDGDRSAVILPTIKNSDYRYNIHDQKQPNRKQSRRLAWMEAPKQKENNEPTTSLVGGSSRVNLEKKKSVNITIPAKMVSATPGDFNQRGTIAKADSVDLCESTNSSSQQRMLWQSTKNKQKSSATDHMQRSRRSIDQESLQHYYDLLAENERLLKDGNKDFETPSDVHCPLGTLKRSNKRKILALEALLMQLPSFKAKGPDMDPISCLNCRYLRLSKQNIIDLEKECLATGRDPGVHAHMDERRVLGYYDMIKQMNNKLTLNL